MEGKKVYMKPKDDSYASFKQFIHDMVHALKPGETIEDDEESTRRAFAAYQAARKKSGASKESSASR